MRPTTGGRPHRQRDPGRRPPAVRAAGLPTPGGLGGGDGGTTDGDDDARGPSVTCPKCGAENDPEFTYCRDCVAELPGSDLFEAADDGDDAGLL